MSSPIRYCSSLFRSRRRIPIALVISIFILILCLSYLIRHHPSRRKLHSLPVTTNITAPTKSLIKNIVESKNGKWPLDDKGRSLKRHFLVLDSTGFFGSGANEGEKVQCPSSQTTFTWTRQQSQLDDVDFFISHDAQPGAGSVFNRLQLNDQRQQYTMAFIMESEVHSSTGGHWAAYNFKMSYNLDDSYPEPATYFDMNSYLIDLLTPSPVSFEQKEKSADIIWIISNCAAHNGRQDLIQRLMHEIKIDSYGACLNNRRGYGARMADNIDAYKKYKFVIAIENSNCYDYVTEKLVKAVASGSIPIVAGRSGRPDYRRYMPQHSYINIFDYSSIKDLADDLKRIANNKTLYESYLWYKKHGKDLSKLKALPLEEKLKEFGQVIGGNATMIIDGIAGKEKSENKVCKLIRFVRQTPWQEIAQHNRTGRADASVACLPGRHILTHFVSPKQ